MAQEETQNFVQRAIITADPQEAVSEFFISKQEDRNIKKYPEWDKPRVSSAFEAIRARRELSSVEEELQAKRIEQEDRRRKMDEQWDEMRRQELTLRQSFIKFNKFVKENHDKRERAENKIAEERERQAKRKQEIDDLTEKLNYMKNVLEDMQRYVEDYRKYQNYLERVVAETSEFQSITDIFNRYETLIETRSALAEHQDKYLRALEETGTEIHHMTEAKSQMLMGLNNKLAQLQTRYDKAKTSVLKWENIVSRIKTTAAAKNLELTQVKTCCWNIYQQICKRKGIPAKVGRDDAEQQLVHIKRTILELKRIIKVAKRRAAKEGKDPDAPFNKSSLTQ
ncbi:hypothetical protein KM043_000775 [Ampulex compressa]|nr:hypothetical protein KM043_000775 [Ampulex compressa]